MRKTTFTHAQIRLIWYGQRQYSHGRGLFDFKDKPEKSCHKGSTCSPSVFLWVHVGSGANLRRFKEGLHLKLVRAEPKKIGCQVSSKNGFLWEFISASFRSSISSLLAQEGLLAKTPHLLLQSCLSLIKFQTLVIKVISPSKAFPSRSASSLGTSSDAQDFSNSAKGLVAHDRHGPAYS